MKTVENQVRNYTITFVVKEFKRSMNSLIVIFACLLMIISFFFPWSEVVFVKFSAYDFAMGAFAGGEISLTQRSMFIFLTLPLISLIQLITERVRGVNNYWLPYFINSLIAIAASLLFLLNFEIGIIAYIVGALLLCAISLKIKKSSNTQT